MEQVGRARTGSRWQSHCGKEPGFFIPASSLSALCFLLNISIPPKS